MVEFCGDWPSPEGDCAADGGGGMPENGQNRGRKTRAGQEKQTGED